MKGIYKGKEYKIVKKRGGKIFCVSENSGDAADGFIPYEKDSHLFIKEVKPEDLEEVCFVYSRCMYKGVEFTCFGENEEDDTYLLMGDESHAKKFPMKIIDRGESIMTVPRSEAEYFEVKKPWDLNRLRKK